MRMRLSLLLVLLVCWASAQLGGNSAAFGVYYLNHPAVVKDLGISQATLAKIKALNQQSQKELRTLMLAGQAGKPDPEMYKKYAQIQRTSQAKLLALLSPAQKTRLNQIALQAAGGFALTSPDVVRQLAITPDQRKKLGAEIRNAMTAYQKQFASAYKGGFKSRANPAEAAKMRATLAKSGEDMRKSIDARAAKILTPQQLAKWKAMLGKPFPVQKLSASAGMTTGG